MNKHTLKHILLDIAQLPRSDQRWIMRQLSKKQHATLAQHQGLKLLTEAQRFRGLKISKNPLPNRPEPLPVWSQQLAHQTPRAIAIVLTQGAYPWQTRFLKQFDQDGAIQTLMQHEIPHIKLLTQKTLFEEWTRTLPFAAQLEECHG